MRLETNSLDPTHFTSLQEPPDMLQTALSLNTNQWSCVLNTDKSIFCLNTDSQYLYLRKECGVQYYPSNIMEVDNYGRLFWDGSTKLRFFRRGTLTEPKYRNKILEPCGSLFRRSIGINSF
ncbi:hypothetical protein TNCV_4865431 [Trichonephila clavipes]|nr:hypothetical protein TNCV_4865431 [Trichonephila clavipes]